MSNHCAGPRCGCGEGSYGSGDPNASTRSGTGDCYCDCQGCAGGARYIGNAFSAGMLSSSARVDFSFLTAEEAQSWARGGFSSCVGHADTAFLVGALLGLPVALRRVTTALVEGDELLVAQYTGPRLPEGATALPEGAKIRWILARVASAQA